MHALVLFFLLSLNIIVDFVIDVGDGLDVVVALVIAALECMQ